VFRSITFSRPLWLSTYRPSDPLSLCPLLHSACLCTRSRCPRSEGCPLSSACHQPLHIKSNYGNIIASSRLDLNGDAYCVVTVVFKTWAQTSRFLSGSNLIPPPRPPPPSSTFSTATACRSPLVFLIYRTRPSASSRRSLICYSRRSTKGHMPLKLSSASRAGAVWETE
jgi:hypothetical protein